MTKIAGSGSISQRHGYADPDPYKNVMDRKTGKYTVIEQPLQFSQSQGVDPFYPIMMK